jgi:hypothetical protein
MMWEVGKRGLKEGAGFSVVHYSPGKSPIKEGQG